MGSLKALVFLRAHLVLLPRRIHFLVLRLNACGPQQITGQVLICNRTAMGETSLGEGTLYHQRGAVPLNGAQPVQQSVQCVEDISAA